MQLEATVTEAFLSDVVSFVVIGSDRVCPILFSFNDLIYSLKVVLVYHVSFYTNNTYN